MPASPSRHLNVSEAARRLGVSAKALRLYEARGLVVPARTPAGYRSYGPAELERAAEVAALRALGLSLAQVAGVLACEPAGLDAALAAHEGALGHQVKELLHRLDRLRGMRAGLARGQLPAAGELPRLLGRQGVPGAMGAAEAGVAFALPWPWGGEWFELPEIRPLTYIIGPLGSGKTRLARRLAEALPSGTFLGLDRLDDGGAAARVALAADSALRVRVEEAEAWLAGEGAVACDALTILLVALQGGGPGALVLDLVEQGLDQPTQEALAAWLRWRAAGRNHSSGEAARPLFVLTRSSALLDLAAVGPDEAILLCPANHSPPVRVAPLPGAPGYEAVATCLATPEVRARLAQQVLAA